MSDAPGPTLPEESPDTYELAAAGYEQLTPEQALAAAEANATWWTRESADYLAEHGASLGDVRLQWGPEGVTEEDLCLLGPLEDLRGARVLEIGAGAAQGSRWLTANGVACTATDVSDGMLRQSAALDARTGVKVPALVADARSLPFDDASFDVAFTSYGAIPFVPDARRVHAEVARVLRPGGRWVFSVTHPIRWAFPDVPGEAGLTATSSYFDRRPYVERDAAGRPLYAEFHRTLGDHVRDVAAVGLVLVDLVEPEWPDWREETWGGWSRLRGEKIPGTAIFVCRRPR